MRTTLGWLRKLLREAMDLSGIDAGAQDLVHDLQKAGFETTWSCQGGPGHEQPWLSVQVRLPGEAHDIDKLRAVAYEYGKGPWRVTPDGPRAYVEIFPTGDEETLQTLGSDGKLNNRRLTFPEQMWGLEGIYFDYQESDDDGSEREYEAGRDYTVGHGTRRLGGDEAEPVYMMQGDVIILPDELQKEAPKAFSSLEEWLAGQEMTFNDIDVIWEDAGSTYFVYPRDSYPPLLMWSTSRWTTPR